MTKRRIKKNKKWTLMKFGFFFYLIINMFVLIWLRTAVVSFEYEIGELDKQKEGLIRERKLVIAQRASFYSAKKIENIAVKQLGMSLSERENIFFVKRATGAGAYRASVESDLNELSRNKLLWKQQWRVRQRGN